MVIVVGFLDRLCYEQDDAFHRREKWDEAGQRSEENQGFLRLDGAHSARVYKAKIKLIVWARTIFESCALNPVHSELLPCTLCLVTRGSTRRCSRLF